MKIEWDTCTLPAILPIKRCFQNLAFLLSRAGEEECTEATHNGISSQSCQNLFGVGNTNWNFSNLLKERDTIWKRSKRFSYLDEIASKVVPWIWFRNGTCDSVLYRPQPQDPKIWVNNELDSEFCSEELESSYMMLWRNYKNTNELNKITFY